VLRLSGIQTLLEPEGPTVDEQRKHAEAVRSVLAERISTSGAAIEPAEEIVCVVEEAAVTIDVGGVETYTVLCTPTDKLALAVGFLFTEGIIERMADIHELRECYDDPDTIRVQLATKIPRIEDAGRNLLIVSSCGACGNEHLRERIDALPKVGDSFKTEARQLRSVYEALLKRQELFEACGGTHAAGVFEEHGRMVASAEDAGRHNALDKALGKCLLAGDETVGRGVVLTSRLSLEMVSKCARAGIELITAVSAPTTLAIEVAQKSNITLCAFARETRATVFTHPARVVGVHK
jgi:FdhD protein